MMRSIHRTGIPALLAIVAAAFIASCGQSPPTAPASRDARTTPPATAGSTISFSGDATAVRAGVLGTNTTLSHAGPLPPSGGADQASFLTAAVPGTLTARVLHASTIGQGDRSRSEASTADLDVTAAGQHVTASFVMARAQAVCTGQGAQASGSSEIANLTINGTAVSVSGSPNQTILLPAGLGRVVINEQAGSPGSITVRALHVIVTGVADVVVSEAHADVACAGTPECSGGDFVTGGGWIDGTPTGAKGTFAVAGGIKNGAFWGHLQFHDHGSGGPSAKGTGVTGYTAVGPTTRRITGTCEINGRSGFTYTAEVADNGEPGRNDTFRLSLSNGYTASGTLRGGNIQLHTPCK